MMQHYNGFEIAVIGLACRFPGARDHRHFWENLKNGVESISFFSDSELIASGLREEFINSPNYIKANSIIEDKEYFDSAFFGYRPDEARLMDPQMRAFHECVWEGLEDAGCNPQGDKKRIGLFAGSTSNMNWELYSRIANKEKLVDDFTAFQLSCGRFLCTRISYLLDLRGPSVFVDTACSTSLYAVHQACKSLLLGECDIAVAGGVTITSRGKVGYEFVEGMINSKDGHCRAFDRDASGTVGGEGAGVVVLKPLKNALQDRDQIWAVIKGTGTNNDGERKVGYTAPSIEGQMEAILTAQKWAGVEPRSISYVEAHGTGTRLGDPIEVEALNRSFGISREKYCALGSVKTNIGHLDAAAGIAGLIKTVLSLRYRKIPPSLHFQHANPEIRFDNSPFYVNTNLKEWIDTGHPRRAGVSSFGIGGTNVHVVVEEAPPDRQLVPTRPFNLLLLSGKTSSALQGNIGQLCAWLTENPEADLSDVAFMLQTCRAHFGYRKMFVSGSREETIALLSAAGQDSENPESHPAVSKPVFMFPGQGAQYRDMCRGLYAEEESFRGFLDNCLDLAGQLAGKDFGPILFSGRVPDDDGLINLTENTQPVLFMIEYALASVLINWGIVPGLMIGHSIGEYVAGCLSGVFTLKDALWLVINRGRLMQRAAEGVMMAVAISEHELAAIINGDRGLSLAAINSSQQCVASGEKESIEQLKLILDEKGYNNNLVRTSHAFHSHMMDPILDEFERIVKNIQLQKPKIPFISNLTGREITEDRATDPQYWVDHLRKTVNFSKGIATALNAGYSTFIEVGPGRALGTFVNAHSLKEETHVVLPTLRHRLENAHDMRFLLSAMGKLWVSGLPVSWGKLSGNRNRRKISLPAYAFDKLAFPVVVDSYESMKELFSGDPIPKDRSIPEWLYKSTWKLAEFAGPPPSNGSKSTLILADNGGIGSALLTEYRRSSQDNIYVSAGSCFKEFSRNLYQVDPRSDADMRALASSLRNHGLDPDHLIHCWGADEDLPDADEGISRSLCFDSLVNLVTVWMETMDLADKKVVVISRGLHPIFSDGPSNPLKALSIAFLKVLSQERPTCSTLHFDLGADDLAGRDHSKWLFSEINNGDEGKVIAFRQGKKWEQMYENVRTSIGHPGQAFRENGVYLITGGLGNLGFALAKQLLARWKGTLILTGRAILQERISRVEELRRQGSTVIYYSCDTSDRNGMKSMVQSIEKLHGPIYGVIHAAGVIGGDSVDAIQQLKGTHYEEQFRPKLQGIKTLAAVFEKKELDFCIVLSSLSSILGGIGFGAYAAANSYMDYFIRDRKARNTLNNWLCLNLDRFADGSGGKRAVQETDLLEILERCLSVKQLPQVLVSTTDLQVRLEDWVYRRSGRMETNGPAASAGKDKDAHISGKPVAQRSEGESTLDRLRQVWQSFFGKPALGLKDNFFEIGGDSLKALTIIGRIHKEFHVEIPVKTFFADPTLSGTAAYIEACAANTRGTTTGYSPIPRAPVSQHYPLSSAQKRLYFMYELDRSSTAYNIFQATRVHGSLDSRQLHRALDRLLDRHEILRTSFHVHDGIPMQKVIGPPDLPIEYYQATGEDIDATIRRFIRPFDLSHAPLVRCGICQLAPDEQLLMIDMPHIISDGISVSILIREFATFYTGNDLPALPLQYKDYAVWQQSAEYKRLTDHQKAFMRNEFSSPPPDLNLPTDFARPAVRTDAGRTTPFLIGEEDANRIRKLSNQQEISVFVFLLACLNILLRKLTTREDIVIGTNTAGRRHPDLENIPGIFVNTLPLRNFPEGEMTFLEFLADVNRRTIGFFENESYQYEELIDDLSIDRVINRNPLFDVLLLYQNFPGSDLTIPGIKFETFSFVQERSKFDLTLTVQEGGNALAFGFEYLTDLFEPATIDRYITYFRNIIFHACSTPETHLADF